MYIKLRTSKSEKKNHVKPSFQIKSERELLAKLTCQKRRLATQYTPPFSIIRFPLQDQLVYTMLL